MNLVRSVHSFFRRAVGSPRGSCGRPNIPIYRPRLEGLEDRVVPAAPSALSPSALAPALAAPLQQATSILPITINNVINQAGSLLANASLGSTNFPIPLALTASPSADPNADCPILNLHLGPIHLDLLGLKVDTSEICLNITAHSGSGNLLGNLLCDISHLLDGGLSLNQILGGLTSTQLSTLTTGLTDLLNGALGQLTSLPNVLSGASVSSAATTRILHLAVGPLDLNLLGLEVKLDNCHNGPVTVDISAESGPGKLLGNLLGGLAHLLDSNAASTGLLNKLSKIADQILALL